MDFLAASAGPIAEALGTTILLAVAAGIGSIVLGTLITAARISPVPVLRWAAFGYVQFFVNVPLLVLLVLAVFALPDAGFLLPLTPTAIIVLTLYEAAYVAEAVRSGVNTVGKGEIEASRALGFTLGQTLRVLVIPQSLRAAIQPIGNVMIALTMNTALDRPGEGIVAPSRGIARRHHVGVAGEQQARPLADAGVQVLDVRRARLGEDRALDAESGFSENPREVGERPALVRRHGGAADQPLGEGERGMGVGHGAHPK